MAGGYEGPTGTCGVNGCDYRPVNGESYQSTPEIVDLETEWGNERCPWSRPGETWCRCMSDCSEHLECLGSQCQWACAPRDAGLSDAAPGDGESSDAPADAPAPDAPTD